ncbi:MAG TPA: hypothetical protein ENH11_00310, partial [Candidatus Acetothermia bacterium]|nr:hypothetical protein [Candidatus Acetothermia bacterium]
MVDQAEVGGKVINLMAHVPTPPTHQLGRISVFAGGFYFSERKADIVSIDLKPDQIRAGQAGLGRSLVTLHIPGPSDIVLSFEMGFRHRLTDGPIPLLGDLRCEDLLQIVSRKAGVGKSTQV